MAVVKDTITLTKVTNGGDGRGILGTPVATYAQSTSGTIPPTTWSATRPNVPAGQYLWTRVVTTYTDNTTSETQTPTLMGKPGDPGLGIKSKSISYAVGTSGITPPTSGWQETIPTVSANQYLWTKTTLVYTDESKTEAYSVGKMGANGADAKLLYLTASAENMAFNADDSPKTTQTINISAKLQNVTGTATFTAIPYIGNTAQTAITLGGSGNTRTLTSAQWTNKDWTLIAITATLDNLSDTLSIVKVKDGATGDKGDQGNQGIPGTPGANGKTPYTHWAYAWSADGTDRFTPVYPGENIIEGGWELGGLIWSDGNEFNASDRVRSVNFIKVDTGLDMVFSLGGEPTTLNVLEYDSEYKIVGTSAENMTNRNKYQVRENVEWLRFVKTGVVDPNAKLKVEIGNKVSCYTPAPSDDFANAYPTYAGTYTDYEPTDSEDPSKYTWQRILGESGQDGKDGEDGANGQDAKEVISGYLSNDSIIVPANASGTVTDFTKALGDFIIYEGQTKVSSGVTYSKVSEIGMTSTINSAGRYTVTALSADVGTVTYQAVYKAVTIQKIMIVVKNKQGATGPAGTNGTDGKGIVSSATTYQAGTSGTTPPTGTWSTSIPSVSENQYLWTKIVLTYSDNTNSTAYSVGKMGAKGETGSTGSTGATGNGIKSTTINFASSTSGTTAPSSGWTTSIPTVASGSFLWTRTVLTFTDNTTNTSYTVAKQGEKGDPTGIISQATVPTNPYVGMLWQNTGASGYIIGATYQWNGSKFNLYIFTADNIVATTLSAITANLGNITAGNISGVLISGSEFQNPFTNEPIDGGDGATGSTASGKATLKGKLSFDGEIDTSHKFSTEYGPARLGGAVRLKTASPTADPALMWWLNPYGLTLRVEGVGGTLRYQDLIKFPQRIIDNVSTGFEPYATSIGSTSTPTCERSMRSVQLSGAFKNTVAFSGEKKMATLPVGYRPSAIVSNRCQGSGNNTHYVSVYPDGSIYSDRYTAGTVPLGSWLKIDISFLAGDV